MREHDFISEAEASSLAGVSENTLRRFAEAGYIKIDSQHDGISCYSRSDICRVFGIKLPVDREPAPETQAERLGVETLSDDVDPEAQAQTATAAPAANNEDVQKLHTIIQLQERLLDLKDKQISDLEDQRHWLKSRIEKLEEKGDRDQMLLLAEAQTIRKLLATHELKKSAWQSTLEWFGLTPKSEQQKLPAKIEQN